MPFDPRLLYIFLASLIGGGLAFLLGLPMPFLLGGIFGAASFVLWYERNGKQLPKMTRWLRMGAAAVIGAMIGTRFSPELLTLLPQFWISALALIPFILIAHLGNYSIMHKLGGYQKLDAYFAALPGGIVDSVLLAEKAGADLRIVTAQHFIRIIIVVVSIPILFWIIDGSAVGSMAGESFAAGAYNVTDLLSILGIAAVGLFIGRLLKLPVAHLIGPTILGLCLSVGGFIQVQTPDWLPHVAQYAMGASLGAQFSGISRKLLAKGLGMGLLSGAFMMGLAALFAVSLVFWVPADFGAMFISFAAGGLAEMSLIALTLNFSPVVVAIHHLIRIFATIYIGNFLSIRVFKLVPKE